MTVNELDGSISQDEMTKDENNRAYTYDAKAIVHIVFKITENQRKRW